MKSLFRLCLIAGLAAMWVGCQSKTEQPAPTGPVSSAPTSDSAETGAPEDLVALTLVKLKVPNMT